MRILLVLIVATASPTFAQMLQLEGEPYQPNAPIIWSATNQLPADMAVYKIEPQRLSKDAISNALAIASFKPITMRPSPDKETMHWQEGREVLSRSLDIMPSVGLIKYYNRNALSDLKHPATGVPTFEEVERLALLHAQKLGADTNELAVKSESLTEGKNTFLDKRGGKEIRKEVYMRGVMFPRQLEGIRFLGAGGRGGFSIEFGNNAHISSFELNWLHFKLQKRFKTASRERIIAWITEGRAVKPYEGEETGPAKRIAITKIVPLYLGETGNTQQDLMYPFAELEMVAETETNKTTFHLRCPIIDADSKSK